MVIVADVQVAGGVEGNSNGVIQIRRRRRYTVSVKDFLTRTGDHRENLSCTVDFYDLVVAAIRDVNIAERIDSDVRRAGEFVVGRWNAIISRSSTAGVGRDNPGRHLGLQRVRHTHQPDK